MNNKYLHLPPLAFILLIALSRGFIMDLIRGFIIKFSPDGVVRVATASNLIALVAADALLVYYIVFMQTGKLRNYLKSTLGLMVLVQSVLYLDRSPIQSENHLIGLVTGSLLALTASVSAYNFIKNRKPVWILMSIGFLYLSLDEFLGIHEVLGNIYLVDALNATGFASVAFVLDHPDDWIIIGYFMVALSFIYLFRKDFQKMFRKPYLKIFLLTGLGFQAYAIFCEYQRFWIMEEVGELLASALYLMAITNMHLTDWFINHYKGGTQ